MSQKQITLAIVGERELREVVYRVRELGVRVLEICGEDDLVISQPVGEQNVVYAQWTQERIEPIAQGGVPEEVNVNHRKMAAPDDRICHRILRTGNPRQS